MKKSIITALVSIPFSLSVFATADGPDYFQVRNVRSDDVLNMRIKPDWRSKKVGEIPFSGICLKNLGCVGGLTIDESTLPEKEQNKIRKKRPIWCKVKYKNIVGWVSGRYIAEGQYDECYK